MEYSNRDHEPAFLYQRLGWEIRDGDPEAEGTLKAAALPDPGLIGPRLPIKVADIGKAGPRPAADD
jgi:hypothetical protein